MITIEIIVAIVKMEMTFGIKGENLYEMNHPNKCHNYAVAIHLHLSSSYSSALGYEQKQRSGVSMNGTKYAWGSPLYRTTPCHGGQGWGWWGFGGVSTVSKGGWWTSHISCCDVFSQPDNNLSHSIVLLWSDVLETVSGIL